MNINDFMNGMNQQQPQIQISKEELAKKVDIFINRCLDEKGYTLESLRQEVGFVISPLFQGMTQIGMSEILPLVLKRIQEMV